MLTGKKEGPVYDPIQSSATGVRASGTAGVLYDKVKKAPPCVTGRKERHMKKKLVLMRHGQTVFNQRKRIQGWVDSPLTPLGIEQAKFSAAYINGLDFTIDHAFSSTSERACDTLELVTNLPYERKKGLKEWNFGILDGEPEYLNPPLDQYDSFFKANGGESRENLISRMNATLTGIMMQESVQNALVVSHGGAIRNFQRFWHPEDKDLIPDRLYNCAVLLFDFDTDTNRFTLTDVFNPNYQGS